MAWLLALLGLNLSAWVVLELAWSLITHQPMWRLVEIAVGRALDSEPGEVRELVRKVAQRRQATSSDK